MLQPRGPSPVPPGPGVVAAAAGMTNMPAGATELAAPFDVRTQAAAIGSEQRLVM
jgi:hypothetical protein